MNLGRMRYRAQIQDYQTSKDADGFVTKQWQTIRTVWADMVPTSGKESIENATETGSVIWKIYIRYTEGIKTTMRILIDSRAFEVLAVVGDKRSGVLTLQCSEVL